MTGTRIALGAAGQRLGVSGGDIRRAGFSRVTSAQLERWETDPPGWLTEARNRKHAATVRKQRRRRERVLVPDAAAHRLQVPRRMLVTWMVDAGIDHPLRLGDAQRWAAEPGSAPAWLQWNLRKQRRLAAQEEAAAQEKRDRIYREVVALLANLDRKLRQVHWLDRHPDHELALADIAWRAAKDCGLASGDERPDVLALSFEQREALRVCGYEVPEPAGNVTPLTYRRTGLRMP